MLLPHLFYEVNYKVINIDTSDGGRFVFSQGDETGFGFHGDFINGWDGATLRGAIDQCLVARTGSGQIRDCAVLYASDDENASSNCPQQAPIVDQHVTGILSALPGCNTPSAGPASVPPRTCPVATFHANTSPGSISDGQTREVPIINVRVVHGALYGGCY